MAVSKRSRAARRGLAQRKGQPLVDHILTVTVQSPRKGNKLGRRTTRDLIVPARAGTRKAELLWLAQQRIDQLPKKERYAVRLLQAKSRKVTIAEGPPTRGRKVKLR